MDFSVLMPVYGKDNVAFFKKALTSVTIEQTLKPSQVVIVQDGPVSSEVDDIISQFAKQIQNIEFTVIKNEENLGLAVALNSGLKACKYNWIARMDSDDISAPNRFELQFDYLYKNPDVDVLGGCIKEFVNVQDDTNSHRLVPCNNKDIYRMAKVRNPINHPTVIYKKSDVLLVGGYSENCGKIEDYKLWIDLMLHNKKFANLNDILLYFRIGNGFIERRSDKREIRHWDMLQEYLLKNNFIGKIQAIKNKFYIRIFIYMPGWMKKLAYRILLRK